MKRKKVLALTMAAAMLFGSSLSAFAATGTASDSTGETVTGEGDVNYVDTTIYSVTLPTSSTIKLVVDPQGLAGLSEGAASAEDLKAYAGKITCASTPVVTNLSSVPMKVSVELTLTGNATGVTTVEAVDQGTGNNVLLYAVPSAVDTLGEESGYVASSTGIVLSTTAATIDFALPAAEYSFVKTVSGGDSVSGGDVSVSYELAEGETGHGTGLSFEGYVNKSADWSDYASGSSSIGMTAKFTFTSTVDVTADTAEGAPYAMAAYSGTKVALEHGPSMSDVTYTQGTGALTIPYSLGSGESAKGAVTDIGISVISDKTYTFSKYGVWGFDTSQAEHFTIESDKIILDETFMNYYVPGTSQIAIVFDDDPDDYLMVDLTVVAP